MKLFIVIEGLDGAGKTTASGLLEKQLKKHYKVKRTYEPQNEMCGGNYIRHVLAKKIRSFSHRTLALAFAANRLDHRDRIIQPWLNKEGNRAIICDRYYLSSLVYQARDGMSFKDILQLNSRAIQPDLIFFLNVDNETCFQRIKSRGQPKELFEENLDEDRKKFSKAIHYLKRYHNDQIIEINASGTPKNTVNQMLNQLLLKNFL